jgi:hypothetical protein
MNIIVCNTQKGRAISNLEPIASAFSENSTSYLTPKGQELERFFFHEKSLLLKYYSSGVRQYQSISFIYPG